LHAKGYPEFARAVTEKTVLQILKFNHVRDPGVIKRIISPNEKYMLLRLESYDVEEK